MRQLHSLIASRVSRKAKIEAPLRPQLPARLLSTAVFGESSTVLIKKGQTVDKWTTSSRLIISKRLMSTTPGGVQPVQGKRYVEAYPPLALGGALSLSTATCAIWFRPMCAPPESIQRDVECRRSKRMESKGDGQAKREV